MALRQALKQDILRLRIYSDSAYLIESRTQWRERWIENEYQTRRPLINADLHRDIELLCANLCVNWVHIPSHSGIIGNEAADHLARRELDPDAKLNSISLEDEVRHQQLNDTGVQQIIKEISKKANNKSYILKDNVLHKIFNECHLIVVPKDCRKAVLVMFHDSLLTGAHRGVATTYKNVVQMYWWKHLNRDVIEYVRTCNECQYFKGCSSKFGKLKPIVTTSTFEKVGVDFIGPFPVTCRGNRFILIATDLFTKFAFTRATRDSSAKTTAEFLFEDVFCKDKCYAYALTSNVC